MANILRTLICTYALALTACSKTNKEQPTVSIDLAGPDTLSLAAGRPANDPGAQAHSGSGDDYSRYVRSDWNAKVNNLLAGYYKVTYTLLGYNPDLVNQTRMVKVRYIWPLPLGVYSGTCKVTMTKIFDTKPISTMTIPVTCTLVPSLRSDQCIILPDKLGMTMTDSSQTRFILGPPHELPSYYSTRWNMVPGKSFSYTSISRINVDGAGAQDQHKEFQFEKQ